MRHLNQRVLLETGRAQIVGTLQLPPEGYRSRLTDYLNASEGGFLALTDATVQPHAGGLARQHQYLAVSARHVELATTIDDEPAP